MYTLLIKEATKIHYYLFLERTWKFSYHSIHIGSKQGIVEFNLVFISKNEKKKILI